MVSITALKQEISDGALIQASAFEGQDLDAMMDQRDRGDFEDDWLKAAESIEAEWESFAEAEAQSMVDEIREIAYLLCFELTGEAEISGYVSDDFELLAKGSLLQLDHPYLNQMLADYREGRFPH